MESPMVSEEVSRQYIIPSGSSEELEAGSEVERPEGIIDKMAPRTE